MKKSMLTYDVLTRFEAEYKTASYTPEQLARIETAAYIANVNHTADTFADFLRILKIDKIEVFPR